MTATRAGYVAFGMRAVARLVLANVELVVEGREHVPAAGPALLVCRHYHHLYDGAALLATFARPVRIVVGLDWVPDARTRRVMELLCGFAGWPIVLRGDERRASRGGYAQRERRAYARAALVRSADLLLRGELVAIFPEGYPKIDPHAAVAREERLPFAGGYLTIAERARRAGIAVPLVPAGFTYTGPPAKPARITLRFGPAESMHATADRGRLARSLEDRVHALSA